MFCHQCGAPAEASARFCAKCGAVLNNEAASQATTAQSFAPVNEVAAITAQSQLAERSTRLGAVMLDFLIFIACLIPGIVVLSVSDSDGGKGFGGALIAVAWLGLAVVQIVLLVKHGQSLGKRALGIRIVRVSDESIPGFIKVVLLRQFVPALIAGIPYAGIVIGLVDALFIFRDDRRCLHDLIAETKVIRI
ncbi:MAG: RDD family protein [Dissulfuribacterales bacterium]